MFRFQSLSKLWQANSGNKELGHFWKYLATDLGSKPSTVTHSPEGSGLFHILYVEFMEMNKNMRMTMRDDVNPKSHLFFLQTCWPAQIRMTKLVDDAIEEINVYLILHLILICQRLLLSQVSIKEKERVVVVYMGTKVLRWQVLLLLLILATVTTIYLHVCFVACFRDIFCHSLLFNLPVGSVQAFDKIIYLIGTAGDNLAFLTKWFEKYPEHKDSDFYITSESYAGNLTVSFTEIVRAQVILQTNICMCSR
ncbi:peptidase S10, serine carboxypeptidase, Alpha/Beta hydrolase fold protein [Artemisia annua]|uniref:Peptidase S10, serine carboxypeptidase, Alpha/Beta hydrolase fold protein n=1 Tax=Artemisia annua TaxID=35608 RepID=A0A2U1QA24_ARTAN|nr:peptidase S10, serine carboxypeptidase, Alpha/Beta hydrolase fold protein [Artemisia annua]